MPAIASGLSAAGISLSGELPAPVFSSTITPRRAARAAPEIAASSPSSTFRERAMMQISSHICSACSMRCVEKRIVFPFAFCSSTISRRTFALIGSSPENGSSRMIRSGSWRTAATNWIFCCIPFDRFSTFRSIHPRSPEPVEPALDARREDRGAREPAKLGEEGEDAAHGHLLVEAALLRQVADPAQRLGTGGEVAEERDRPFVGLEDVVDHPDRRRLAGTVRAEEPVDDPLRHAHREVRDGDVPGVALRDVRDGGDRVGHGRSAILAVFASPRPIVAHRLRSSPGRSRWRRGPLCYRRTERERWPKLARRPLAA